MNKIILIEIDKSISIDSAFRKTLARVCGSDSGNILYIDDITDLYIHTILHLPVVI